MSVFPAAPLDNAANLTERAGPKVAPLAVGCQLQEYILYQASGRLGVLKNRGLSTAQGSRVLCIDRGEFMAAS
jgi:hypothetical protein